MTTIVLDTSYALAMMLPDESRPTQMEQLLAARLIVPAIWPLEVANAFRNGLRRRRHDASLWRQVCTELELLEIEVIGSAHNSVRQHVEAALKHGLTPYDASYLELALQRRCPLATLDDALASAARHAGLTVMA